ncbi:MAG: hypothetical protein ACK5LK_08130, partial [Chthoniobacterales bacterium]
PQNERDGRVFNFTAEQFGKPRSHSADPRIMKLIPSLPELLEKAVLLETEPEVDPENYRNIDAWHTYGVRVNLDGQALFVQLSTFEQNGVEMIALYHDHNVLWEEAYHWAQKNSESQSGGPTDPVTNRAVTPEALAKNTLFQLLSAGKQKESELSKNLYLAAAIDSKVRVYPGKLKIEKQEGLTDAERALEAKVAEDFEENTEALLKEYDKRFGKNVNTDDVRDLVPEYVADRSTWARAVHEPSSALAKVIFANALKGPERVVNFMAGGGGSGKGVVLGRVEAEQRELTFDGTQANQSGSVKKIE